MVNFFRKLGKYYIETFKNIAKNSSILTTMVLSVFFYSFFYPTAYQAQTAENLPIIIVDEEQSEVSNTIITQIAKSPNIKITEITTNFEEANKWFNSRKLMVFCYCLKTYLIALCEVKLVGLVCI